MSEIIDTVFNYLTLFDAIYAAITLLTVIQSSKKGFTLSLLSTSKWILAIIITIITVPKLKSWANRFYGSGNIIFVISGNFSNRGVISLFRNKLKKLQLENLFIQNTVIEKDYLKIFVLNNIIDF